MNSTTNLQGETEKAQDMSFGLCWHASHHFKCFLAFGSALQREKPHRIILGLLSSKFEFHYPHIMLASYKEELSSF